MNRSIAAGLKLRHPALPVCLLAIAALSNAAPASESLTTAQARSHIGDTATVCGHVAGAHYAPRSHGQPTFLNMR